MTEILFSDYVEEHGEVVNPDHFSNDGTQWLRTHDNANDTTNNVYAEAYWINIPRYNIKNNTAKKCVDKKDSSREWIIPVLDCNMNPDTGHYGERLHPVYKEKKMHYGVDLSGSGCKWSPILAVAAGKVITATFNSSAGYHVEIEHDGGFMTRYLHMGGLNKSKNGYRVKMYNHIVKAGQNVEAGQIIGAVGTSGTSTGEHLHFGLKLNGVYVDPEDYIDFSSTTKATPVKVQREPIVYDDFLALFNNKSSSYSNTSAVSHYLRRRNLIADCSVVLHENGKMNKNIGSGCSCIGPIKNNESDDVSVEVDVEEDNSFKSPQNPYVTDSYRYYNNAYAFGKAKKIIDEIKGNYEDNCLCKDRLENWYEYNRNNRYFDYGQLPRKYSIMCWENTGSPNEKTRVAIVDEVISTDIVTISECSHLRSDDDYSELEATEMTLTNANGNWGCDKSNYKFLGFIYLLNNSKINPCSIVTEEDGCETVVASKDIGYSTLIFSTKEIKHYNKVRIIYDINAHSSVGTASELDCGVRIMASQQVIKGESLDSDWDTTRFDLKETYAKAEDKQDPVCFYPFPLGAIQLANFSVKDIVGEGVEHRDETFVLNKCSFDNSSDFNTFSNDKYAVFNREHPLHISITPISYIVKSENSATVEVTVKKIILYR